MGKGVGCVVAVGIGLLVAVLAVGGWYVGVRNRLVSLDESVTQQWAQVESQYQRRFDLIPNLVRTVQGAANFEKSTLQAVTEARARVGQIQAAPAGGPPTASPLPNDQNAMTQYAQAQQGLWGAVSRLIAVSEAYPDLKSNQNFLQLQSELEGTENRIAVERMRYNEKVQAFNTGIRRFPGSLAASFGGFKPKAYFQGAAGSSQAPEVNFQK
jgi:LemA protein